MFSLASLLQVAIGGAIGSVLRHLAVLAFGAPWAVMGINILGSFCIGVLYVALSTRLHLSPLLMTGLLGGFTTFSAFAMESVALLRSGQTWQALAYAGGSTLTGLALAFLGYRLATLS